MEEPAELASRGEDETKRLLMWLHKINSPRLTLRANFKGKNRLIWRQYRLAYIDQEEKPYVMCVDCQTFVKYSSRTGTGGLVRHYCFRQLVASLEAHNDPQLLPALPKPSTATPVRLEVEDLVMKNSPRIGYVPNYKGKSTVWHQFDIITLDNEAVNFAACKLCRGIVTYISRTGTGSMARHKCNAVKRDTSNLDQNFRPEDLAKRVKQEDQEDGNNSTDSSNLAGSNLAAQLQLNAFSQMLQANLQNFRSPKSEPSSSVPAVTVPPDPSSPLSLPPTSPQSLENVVRSEYIGILRTSLDVFRAMRNESFFELAQSLVNMGAEYGKVDIRHLLHSCTDFDSVLNVVD